MSSVRGGRYERRCISGPVSTGISTPPRSPLTPLSLASSDVGGVNGGGTRSLACSKRTVMGAEGMTGMSREALNGEEGLILISGKMASMADSSTERSSSGGGTHSAIGRIVLGMLVAPVKTGGGRRYTIKLHVPLPSNRFQRCRVIRNRSQLHHLASIEIVSCRGPLSFFLSFSSLFLFFGFFGFSFLLPFSFRLVLFWLWSQWDSMNGGRKGKRSAERGG